MGAGSTYVFAAAEMRPLADFMVKILPFDKFFKLSYRSRTSRLL